MQGTANSPPSTAILFYTMPKKFATDFANYLRENLQSMANAREFCTEVAVNSCENLPACIIIVISLDKEATYAAYIGQNVGRQK